MRPDAFGWSRNREGGLRVEKIRGQKNRQDGIEPWVRLALDESLSTPLAVAVDPSNGIRQLPRVLDA